MKRITVTLTEDQARNLHRVLEDHANSLAYTVEKYSAPREEISNYLYWIADGLDGTKQRLAFDTRILDKLNKARLM